VRLGDDWAVDVVAELAGVTKRYGQVAAIDGVDFQLAAGQVTALLGPNGAGKTTAVRMMLGLAAPTTGVARLFGGDPRRRAARQRLGVMLQVSKVPETLSVIEHLRLFSKYYDAPRSEAAVIDAAGLAGLERRRFGTLSGGERQRLLFGLAMCGDPDLLVLDEPTVGLDVESRRVFWREMRKLAAEGRSLLLTTHYIEEADALADRVVIVQHGRIVADGSTAAIKARVEGRCIRCVTNLDVAAIAAMRGVTTVTRERDVSVVRAMNAEAVVRDLLSRDPSLSDLEIARIGLEDAFLALTQSAPGERDALGAAQ
jgi:ABC-2 type transport system ATP-binding protein